MTDYTDFIHDFPARCRDVLELAYGPAQARDREVTLLIMTATAAFLVPFERLRAGEHPAQDRQLYPELARQLDSALGKPFLESPFHDGGPRSWATGKIDNPEASTQYKPLTNQTPAGQVLAIIRNSLAHGNLFTIGGRNLPIKALFFFSENRKHGDRVGYKYVHVSPADFHGFLARWLSFLEGMKIPPVVVAQALARTE
jgi:hypothetical protein